MEVELSLSALQIVGALVGQVVVAGAVYGGIRADLRGHAQRLSRVEELTDRAHTRIDQVLTERS